MRRWETGHVVRGAHDDQEPLGDLIVGDKLVV